MFAAISGYNLGGCNPSLPGLSNYRLIIGRVNSDQGHIREGRADGRPTALRAAERTRRVPESERVKEAIETTMV